MKALLVSAHVRPNSLTKTAAAAFAEAAADNGHEIEWANLVSEGFDPVLREPDEPDWSNPDKVYSSGVIREMERIERNQATVIVFPVGGGRYRPSSRGGSTGFGTTVGPTGDETTRTNAFG